MSKREYIIKRMIQIVAGLVFIAISILIVIMASKGNTLEDRDGTAILFTLPIGICLIFTRKIII